MACSPDQNWLQRINKHDDCNASITFDFKKRVTIFCTLFFLSRISLFSRCRPLFQFLFLWLVNSLSSTLQCSILEFREFVKQLKKTISTTNFTLTMNAVRKSKLNKLWTEFDASQCLILQRINHTIFNGLASNTICFGKRCFATQKNFFWKIAKRNEAKTTKCSKWTRMHR